MTEMTATRWLSTLALTFVLLCTPLSHAEVQVTLDRVLEGSAEDLRQGKPSEAIRTLEAVADRGMSHPELSFNRGLAYLERAKSPSAVAGDSGQAAAGFAETLQFRPGDPEAARGLEEAQLLVARKKSQANTSAESLTLGLVERVILRMSPLVLLIVAGVGSLALCVSFILHRAKREPQRLSGSVLTLVGALMLLPTTALYFTRSALFQDSRVAVVVGESAQVLDEAGGRAPGRLPLREGTVVYVKKSSSGLFPLVSLGRAGYVSSASLRFLGSTIH